MIFLCYMYIILIYAFFFYFGKLLTNFVICWITELDFQCTIYSILPPRSVNSMWCIVLDLIGRINNFSLTLFGFFCIMYISDLLYLENKSNNLTCFYPSWKTPFPAYFWFILYKKKRDYVILYFLKWSSKKVSSIDDISFPIYNVPMKIIHLNVFKCVT